MSYASKIAKAANNPKLAVNILKGKLIASFASKEFVGERLNRSDSDNGLYVKCVEAANRDYKIFQNFKQHPHYQSVLEHVTKEQGKLYLDIIQRNSPELYRRIKDFKVNDLVGNPTVFDYGEPIGRIAPSTLRYVKVLSDLIRIFGDLNQFRIAEIGVGYGGQILLIDKVFTCRFYLFDLRPVIELSSKYLEAHVLDGSYRPCTLNKHDGRAEFDLVISNYAFSELPSHLQDKYIQKVLSRAKRGYITMNSGFKNEPRTIGKLSFDALKERLPNFDVIKEEPLTSANNYIIIWGA